MKKCDELKGPSCLTRAADDEPLFVLRANDELAPQVVRYWAHMYQQQKTGGGLRQMTARERAKQAEAIALATAMEQWEPSP